MNTLLGEAASGGQGVAAVGHGASCCVCLEEVDYRGSTLIECARCKIHVHVKCYGLTVSTDGSTWLCEACTYMTSPAKDTTTQPAQKTEPFCIVCPCAGGALRLTNQPGIWCHVLCMNWIPELSHSLSGEMNEVLDIRLLDRSRESLKCKICGQKGGCIQCVSGRCARPFHVICAMRSPSDSYFTGYNNDNQQVYHCTTHLSDIATFKYEMVDQSWKQSPILLKFLAETPRANRKCRVCGNKMPSNHLDRHEKLCFVGWLAKEEMRIRRKVVEASGTPYPRIEYSRGGSGGSKGKMPNTPSKSSSKNRKNGPPTRPCPQCGEHVRETLMMGHMKNNCKKTRGSAKCAKNPVAVNRQNSAHHEPDTVDLTQDSDPPSAVQDLLDVLFATWPGQSAGSQLDSTNFWRILNSHFFSNKPLLKKRMEPLCKNLCGARLEDMGDLNLKPSSHDSINCSDRVLFDRSEDSTLEMKSIVHRCDFMMRGSRTRCLDDLSAKPVIEIRHGASTPAESAPANGKENHEDAVSGDGTKSVMVQIKNADGDCVSCRYGFHVNNPSAANQASDVWSRYHADAISTLVGADLEKSKPALPDDAKLWVSLQDVQDGLTLENETQRDELTPEVNLLVDKLREQMRQNRYRVRSLCVRTQRQDLQDAATLKERATVESYYREFALWKSLCKGLLVGYREFWRAKPEEEEPEPDSAGKSADWSSNAEGENEEPVDDGTCVVCFDGQSPESNPIIFCDRCDLAVHQRCYGIQYVPNNEFYCDRCRLEDNGQDSASDVYCQLCPLRDGAFKKTIDGKWVHVMCALWCPGVWIGNLQSLSDIKLVNSAHQSRFIDTINEVNAITNSQVQDVVTAKRHSHQALKHGSLCQYCRVACGRTIQCCHEGCTVSFHPLCGWFEGIPMTVSLDPVNGYVYSGGGDGLSFQLLCGDHLPEDYAPELRVTQAKHRRRFRIDSFFQSQSKLQPVPVRGGGGGSASSAIAVDESSSLDVWTDRELCAACFDYSSPVPSDLQDNSQLSKRQLMMRCQYCNTFIHAACCLSEIDDVTDLFRSNWICERCTLVDRSKQISVTSCIVCDRSSDYMMPCLSHTPNSATGTDTANVLPASQPSSLLPNGSQNSNGVHADRWIHVLCAKMSKAKSVKRHHILCAANPVLGHETNGRCDLCQKRGRNLVSCGGCPKRFHPTCAARKKFYVSRSSKSEWKFFCPTHPPANVAYDEKRQAWFTGEILGHLHELRLMLERGRMIVEMARQRDRQKKRMLNLCSIKKMELSMEMILKKRPTAIMKETFEQYTGEAMEDVPKKPVPVAPRSRTNSSKGRSRYQIEDADQDDEQETRRSSRRSTNADDNGKRSSDGGVDDTPRKRRRVDVDASETTPSRRSSRRSEASNGDDDEDSVFTSPGGRPSRAASRNRSSTGVLQSVEASEREPRRKRNRALDLSPAEFDLSSIPEKLLRVTQRSDFDEIIPDIYPELVD